MSLEERLRRKYKDNYSYDKLDERFVDLRVQKFRLEALPDTLSERDVVKLEKRRQNSPVVPLKDLFSKMKGDKDAPKKVLTRGRPGVGKTTLVEYVAREWARGNLWPEIHYLFVIKIRELLETTNWSLSDLLFGNLQLSGHYKNEFLEELCEHSSQALCIVDGLDEFQQFEFTTSCRFPVENKVNLSTMISSVLSCSLLPDAKVILTTRPTNNIPPCQEFGRVVDIYGFTREGIELYVDKFCADKEELRQYIRANIDTNANLATFCHTPILCRFVCEILKDVHENPEQHETQEEICENPECTETMERICENPEHVTHQDMKTMTQLFVTATYRIGKKLHPILKYDSKDREQEEILSVLKESFRKHAALAKSGMTNPLKLIFSEYDLTRKEFTDVDKQTGFLSGSNKTSPYDTQTHTRTWSYSHLTLQEFFGAFGLLQGPEKDVLKLLRNKESRKQKEMVITFLLGLLGDARNGYFLKCLLGSVEASLDLCTKMIEQLAKKLKNDALKLATFVFETQCKDLVKYMPEKINASTIYPAEMLSLCWVLQQDTCRITHVG